MFDIGMFNLTESVQSNIGMLSTKFSINEYRNVWYWNKLSLIDETFDVMRNIEELGFNNIAESFV